MSTTLIRDPHTVPVEFVSSTEHALTALANLRYADDVAIDTETEIVKDADGNPVRVDFDVDGPGPWRVMSIAARYGKPGPDAQYRAWVLDMKYVYAAHIASLFAGIRPWGWNANFDRFVLARGGLIIRKWWDGTLWDADIKQGAYYANGARPWYTSLEAASIKWAHIAGIEGKEDTRYSYDMASETLTPEQVRYAADDAIATLWVSEELVVEAKKHDLFETAVRDCNAQAFIDSMAKNGLPLDVEGYQAVIDEAKAKADAAAEHIAVVTTGRQLLDTVVRWAAQQYGQPEVLQSEDSSYVVERGLAILRDEKVFGQFIDAVRQQIIACREQMAALTGSGEAVQDLFSDAVIHQLPFDPDNDTTVRRWLSKTAPVFTAEFIAANGGGSKALVKAHDMYAIYAALRESQADGVTVELRNLAVVLASYRRYSEIIAVYGAVIGPVKLKPDWNINSGDQVKAMINAYFEAEVQAYTSKKDGFPHPLGKTDTVDSDALTLIGGELAKALLEFREHIKTVTTYGDELMGMVHPKTGRVHAKYTQGLTGTGRLSSHSPNAQNLNKASKIYIRPSTTASAERVTRVLGCADLSQAELRVVANESGDENMLEAFRSGEDLHTRTSALMFNLDMKALVTHGETPAAQLVGVVTGVDKHAAEDPAITAAKLYKKLRQKAKSVAFGYNYGLKGASLARQLTVQGVPTTKEEADELLAAFDRAYPQLAAWMARRVAFIESLSSQMKETGMGCNFEDSWRLHRLYAKAAQAQRTLKGSLGRKPTHTEVAQALVSDADLRASIEAAGGEVTDEVIAVRRASQAEQVAWALGHYGSAVLAEDGTPWSFESRTKAGRRKLFQVGTKDWLMAMVSLCARSRKKYAVDLREAWAATYNGQVLAEHQAGVDAGKIRSNVKPKTVSFTKRNPTTGRDMPLDREELEKMFEGDEIKVSFISFVLDAYNQLSDPAGARHYLFRHAMADRIRASSNQYRNHPIQGGVADAVLVAYSRIDDDLTEKYPTAGAIQSVHDSIVVECDLVDAKPVLNLVVRHMEEALAEMYPNVPCVADGDVQLSLDADKTTVSDEDLERMLAELPLAA